MFHTHSRAIRVRPFGRASAAGPTTGGRVSERLVRGSPRPVAHPDGAGPRPVHHEPWTLLRQGVPSAHGTDRADDPARRRLAPGRPDATHTDAASPGSRTADLAPSALPNGPRCHRHHRPGWHSKRWSSGLRRQVGQAEVNQACQSGPATRGPAADRPKRGRAVCPDWDICCGWPSLRTNVPRRRLGPPGSRYRPARSVSVFEGGRNHGSPHALPAGRRTAPRGGPSAHSPHRRSRRRG